MELGVHVATAQVRHSLELALRLVEHRRPVERDAEVAMLGDPGFHRYRLGAAAATESSQEAGGRQSEEGLAHLEVIEAGFLDDARDVAAAVDQRDHYFLFRSDFDVALGEVL